MPGDADAIYQRGKYWLAWDKRADGSLRSPYLAVFWYERPPSRRIRSRSSRTTDLDAASAFLDRLYLADRDEAPAFCPTCGRPHASASRYLIADAIADYRLEHADALPSAVSIRSRLGNVLDFLEATGRSAATCAEAGGLVAPMRAWLAQQPVKGHGWTSDRKRTPAAVEEAIAQLRAALNHAKKQERIESVPVIQTRGRAKVTPKIKTRLDLETLARMLRYAADPKWKRRRTLHAFMVGTICTVARPDAVVDISTNPAREQWEPGAPALDLNPKGREQTKKVRPIVPVFPVMAAWLSAVHTDKKANGWLCEVAGEPIHDVDSAWLTMLEKLELPTTRNWKPYILRRSLATMMRERGASKWDVEGMMGHRGTSTTELYAISSLYPSAFKALGEIVAELETLAPGCLHRRCTGDGAEVVALTPRKSADGSRG